jgi:hypothetical protein
LRKDGLCSKIKLLLAKIGFTHAWMNQGTFSKPKLLHSLSIKLEDRYINHWKTLLFNDDNKNGDVSSPFNIQVTVSYSNFNKYR